MKPHLLPAVADFTPFLSTVVLLLLAIFVYPRIFVRSSLSTFPLWAEELSSQKRRNLYRRECKDIYLKGYTKFKDAVGFRVTSADEIGEKLVISPKYLDELRKLPDSVLSIDDSLGELLEKKYTRVPAPMFCSVTPHVVKADLTAALPRINPILSSEVDKTVLSELGSCDTWTPINIYQKLLRTVTIVSGRVFIGPELCHDERYIDSAMHYTTDLMMAVGNLKGLNPWLKPFQGPFLPSVVALRKREHDFIEFLKPTVEARRKALDNNDPVPDDMLTWLIQRGDKSGVSLLTMISQIQLSLSFTAIHTTTLTATNVFYSLAAHPEYMAPLRDEIRTVLNETNGVLTFSALQRLSKMDSFIKECLRIEPAGWVAMSRKVIKGFTLSTGQFVPAGTMIEVPAHAVSRDPDIFPEPEVFKPWRFTESRNRGAEGAPRRDFVSLSSDLMTFGYGRHACPGRFFAANEIKMIIARVLTNYDIKMEDGKTERYKNLEYGLLNNPDPTKTLMFKSVTL